MSNFNLKNYGINVAFFNRANNAGQGIARNNNTNNYHSMRTLFWNYNTNQLNNTNNNESRRANAILNESNDTFDNACEELAKELMIATWTKPQYDLSVFIDDYLPKVKSGQYTLRRALEKYVLDASYGKGKMNNKLNMKYNGSAANKYAKLVAIRNYINNPSKWRNGSFNWANVNDPDYYDLGAAQNHTNIDWYTNSLNSRINYYKRKAKL